MADYAIVVGISEYPELQRLQAAARLEGPEADAEAIYQWLVTAGGVPAPNVVKITRTFPAGQAPPHPAHAVVEKALIDLAQQAANSGTAPFGRRLYLYFAGHGFAPDLEEAALFTADATTLAWRHIFAHDWLKWFRRAMYFEEYILWMDCCMRPGQSILAEQVPLQRIPGVGVPGPFFIGLAAHTRSALELAMDDGKVHGVFTWTLLKGLRGGAADSAGNVTGESLASFLFNSMSTVVPAALRGTNAVDVTPYVQTKPGLVFARLQQPVGFRVSLDAPGVAAGTAIDIWGGAPAARVQSAVLNSAWSGSLPRGLYVAEVPGAGLRQAFEVTGARDVERVTLTDHGPAITPAAMAGSYPLTVVAAGNPAATISVISSALERVKTGTGSVSDTLPAGVYKIRVEVGRSVNALTEEIVCLDQPINRTVGSPAVASPAPIPGTAQTHEFHMDPFTDAAAGKGPVADIKSGVYVMARYWTPPSAGQPLVFPDPFEGIELIETSTQQAIDLKSRVVKRDSLGQDPVSYAAGVASPGEYVLRQILTGGRVLDMSLMVCPGWLTQVVIQRDTPLSSDPRSALGEPGQVAVFMRRKNDTSTQFDAVLETARTALAQNRNMFAVERGGYELEALLTAKFENPIAGIIGAHLLLIAQDHEFSSDRAAIFDQVVENLRALVRIPHPDVEALSLRASEPLRTREGFRTPPLFHRSWRLMVDATAANPGLIDAELWGRVHASTGLGGYFAWAADQGSRRAHRRQLAEWLTAAQQPLSLGAPAAGHRLSATDAMANPMIAGPHASVATSRGGPDHDQLVDSDRPTIPAGLWPAAAVFSGKGR